MTISTPYRVSFSVLRLLTNLKFVAGAVHTSSVVNISNTKPTSMASFHSVPSVEIDPEGTFKYILIKLYEKDVKNEDGSEKFRYLVRGNASSEFHGDIYDAFMATLNKKLDSECVGGGRIKHNPEEKKILVYGYSQGFGKADHSISKQLLVEKYPDYTIDWSNEGY